MTQRIAPFVLPHVLHALIAATVILSAACTTPSSHPVIDAYVAPIPGEAVTVFAAGDIADCRRTPVGESMAARTADVIAAGLAETPGAVALTLGDNAYQTGTIGEYTDCYGPTWGRFKARTLPSPGNHEYYSAGAAGYYAYFGALAGPEQRGYYSVDIGGWHLTSLNSNLKGAAQLAQIEWLKADLAAHPSLCSLAYWHHPFFSSGEHGNNPHMKEIWALLAAAGTEMVLSGHDHDYERFAPQDTDGRADAQRGMRQFVVGSGGAALTPFLLTRPNREAASNTTHGVIKLRLKPTGYEWEFLPAAGGTFHDQGSALCHR